MARLNYDDYRDALLYGGNLNPDRHPIRSRLVIGSTEFRYKPGWQMHYTFDALRDTGYLHLAWSVPDAYHPERMTQVVSTSAIDPRSSPHLLQAQVYEAIKTAEQHEIDEFFLVDGVRPYDPHRRAP